MQYRDSSYSPGVFASYWFMKNMQGDIVSVYSNSGTLYISYTYDAWGNVTTSYHNNGISSAAYYNPFKYRGYYYDSETGFYYLNSRYYDPVTCRFINADNNFTNNNLFIYCSNNAVSAIDSNGEHWYYLWLDDLFEAAEELLASVSNIVYGKAAFAMSFTDPQGASELWNSRPFQDIHPSTEMQIFTEVIYEQNYVFDLSVTVDPQLFFPNAPDNTYIKVGVSKLISPSTNIDATYVHAGGGASTPSVSQINFSYSVGIVNGVQAKEDYAKDFFDMGAGALCGFDYCFWPNGASAYSFTIGTSYGVYAGYDYYWYLD